MPDVVRSEVDAFLSCKFEYDLEYPDDVPGMVDAFRASETAIRTMKYVGDEAFWNELSYYLVKILYDGFSGINGSEIIHIPRLWTDRMTHYYRELGRRHYKGYLGTFYWRQIVRRHALSLAGDQCQTPWCSETDNLEVHHGNYTGWHYDHLGDELRTKDQLLVLCGTCHELIPRTKMFRRAPLEAWIRDQQELMELQGECFRERKIEIPPE